ncbi:hypothetical protein C8R46DRAFT_1065559 [Mycena filopes]|nr:hypothetical protein C8R46DRAFT_1065559 [Mycena filopes]
MSSSELSLRHLPDLSDASFSFQIPTDSSDDLLRADAPDFFGAGGGLLGSPTRTNDAPLTLDDLTPLRTATAPYGSTPHQKATKSLLPTTRSNIQDLTSSQAVSRVPKPVSSVRKRKEKTDDATPPTKPMSRPAVSTDTLSDKKTPHPQDEPASEPTDKLAPIDEVPAVSSSLPVVEQAMPNEPEQQNTPTQVALPVVLQPATGDVHSGTKSKKTVNPRLEEKQDTPTQVSVPVASKPAPSVANPPNSKKAVPAKPASRAKTTAPPANRTVPVIKSKTATTSNLEESDSGGIAARLLMYGAQMMASFPPSDDAETPRNTTETETEPELSGAVDVDAAMGNLLDGDSELPPPEMAMVVESALPLPHLDAMPTDDPLTLSQLSPRKNTTVEGDRSAATANAQPERSVSPMRPSVKRPASAASVDPMARSKKRAPGPVAAPRVPSVESARGSRGRGGRTVSAPSQVRREQPPRRGKAPVPVMGPPAVNAHSTRPRVPSANTKDKRDVAPSSSGKHAGPIVPVEFNFHGRNNSQSQSHGQGGASSSGRNAGPTEFNFQGSSARGVNNSQGSGETQPRAKGYTIPDFKSMHAAQAAQSALRRSQLAQSVTVPVPIAFNTDIRAREREAFEARVREREAEEEREKEARRLEREAREEEELKEARRRAVPKAHEVPEWYKEAPRKARGEGAGQ